MNFLKTTIVFGEAGISSSVRTDNMLTCLHYYNYLPRHEGIRKFFRENPRYILFGEVCKLPCEHYGDDECFYLQEVYSFKEKKMLDKPDIINIAEEFGIKTSERINKFFEEA